MTDIVSTINALDDDFGFWVWTSKVLDPAAIGRLEADIGLPFPADYRAFLQTHGCLAVQATEEVWPRPKPYAVGPLWAHQFGLEVYGIANEGPPPLNVRNRYGDLVKQGITDQLPVAGIMGDSALLVVDRGGNYAWLHRGDRQYTPGTFTSILNERLALLARDKDKAKRAGASLWS